MSVEKIPEILDFAIIGSMKTGTTSLFRRFTECSAFNMSSIKEPNFFNDPQRFGSTWLRGLPWYESLFAQRPGLRGEASTSYTKAPRDKSVAARLFEHAPNAKLIYLVRNPVDRSVSHYLHNVLAMRETSNIRDALLASPSTAYVSCSMYHRQISEYLQYFSKESIFVGKSEALWGQPREFLSSLFKFLHVEPEEEHLQALPRANSLGSRLRRLMAPLGAESNRAIDAVIMSISEADSLDHLSSLEIASRLGFGLGERSELALRFEPDIRCLQDHFSINVSDWDVSP